MIQNIPRSNVKAVQTIRQAFLISFPGQGSVMVWQVRGRGWFFDARTQTAPRRMTRKQFERWRRGEVLYPARCRVQKMIDCRP